MNFMGGGALSLCALSHDRLTLENHYKVYLTAQEIKQVYMPCILLEAGKTKMLVELQTV